jgi:hypothetical protein
MMQLAFPAHRMKDPAAQDAGSRARTKPRYLSPPSAIPAEVG